MYTHAHIKVYLHTLSLYTKTMCDLHHHVYYKDIIDEDAEEKVVKSFDDLVSGWFKFVQTEDGAVPAVYHDSSEDIDAVNFKKQIAAAFQANFKGAGERLEADPQSLHVAQYG